MKKINPLSISGILLLLLLLGLNLVLAACPEIQEDCVTDFMKNPSPQNFNTLQNPTAEQFAKLQNPTPEQFNHLDESQKQVWITNRADFSNQKHRDLANNFFASSPAHINQNKERFKDFLSKSWDLTLIQFTGDVSSYSEDGTLKGKVNSVNVKDFKGKFGQNYKLGVVKGELKLYQAESKQEMSFTGNLRKDGTNTFSIPSGSINGHSITGGIFIRMNKDGSLSGSFDEFDKIKFAYTTSFSAIATKEGRSIITLNGGKITSISQDAVVYLRGKVEVDRPEILQGKIAVPKGSSLTVNGVKVVSSTKEVNILGMKISVPYLENVAQIAKNGVIISDKVQASGEGFSVSTTAQGLISQEEQVTSDYLGYLKLPKRGYFQQGDSSPDVALLQRIVGLKETGVYDATTEEAVSKWQASAYSQTGVCGGNIVGSKCVGDGKFGLRSREAYLKINNGKIKVTPNKGVVALSNSPSGVEIKANGAAKVSLGPKSYDLQYTDTETQFYQELNPTCDPEESGCVARGNDVNVPVKIKQETPSGEEKYAFEQQPSKPVGKPVKVTVGTNTYELHEGEAYVVTAGQTAFTKAVAPTADSAQLQNLPPELRNAVAKAGHMAVLYVENGKLRVSESDWGGVKDVPFQQSHLYDVRKSISGIYSIPNADSSKIIAGSKADSKKGIGWFFMPVENQWGVQQVNSAT
ncbi:MAG: hypothetical protein AABX04_01340 [Nanoarchaeota archaeon]